MSAADVESLKIGFAAFNEGDFDRMLENWHEDAVVVRLDGGETVNGKEAIRDWLVPDAIEQQGKPTGYHDCGDRVLVTCDWRVRGKGSGAEVDTQLFLLFTMSDGKVARSEAFLDQTEALRAAGAE